MMIRRLQRACAVGVALCVAAGVAHAHLLPPQHVTLNVQDSAVFGAFSIPVSAFSGWDDDRDGRLSDAEFLAHRERLLAALDAGIGITSDGAPGRRDLLLPSIDGSAAHSANNESGTHLLVLVRQSFAFVPASVTLRLSLFGTRADESEYLIRATNHGAPEVATLRAGMTDRTFFQPPFTGTAVVRALRQYGSAAGTTFTGVIVGAAGLLVLRRRKVSRGGPFRPRWRTAPAE